MSAKQSQDEPRCVEAGCSASVGAKVQIIKFEFDENAFFSWNRRYEVPEGWTEDQVTEFQALKTQELYEAIQELHAQPAVNSMMDERDRLYDEAGG